MNQRSLQLAQVVTFAMLAWFGYQLLARAHLVLVITVVTFVTCNTVVLWMLRFDRQRLGLLYSKPFVARYVNWLCYWAGEQLPPSVSSTSMSDDFLLNTDDEFRVAAWRAKHTVLGHDRVVDCVLSRIRDAVMLRKRLREGTSQPPLASFLFVGGEGIGKKYLARVVAKLFYRDGSVFAIECDKEARRGVGQNCVAVITELLDSVRRQPSQLLLLEHIDAAPPDLLEALSVILTHGSCRHPTSGRVIAFQHTIIVMTTTKAAPNIASLSAKMLTERAWLDQAAEVICSETSIEQSFVRAVGDIALCRQLSDEDKARVTAILMAKECKVHGLALTQVDPMIIASEVLRIEDSVGFGPLPQYIKKLLAKPILAASEHHRTRLSLRVRMPQTSAE